MPVPTLVQTLIPTSMSIPDPTLVPTLLTAPATIAILALAPARARLALCMFKNQFRH